MAELKEQLQANSGAEKSELERKIEQLQIELMESKNTLLKDTERATAKYNTLQAAADAKKAELEGRIEKLVED